MRLASYIAHGRTSYGAVVGDGVVDLRMRLGGGRYATLTDVIRACALDDARAAVSGVRADFRLAEIELLPPVLTPEKILCIGINYANRNADFNDPSVAEISEHVLSASGFAGRLWSAAGAPQGVARARL